ncbi:MAG: glycosyltransferase family 39 protein [Xanthomonadaceae bacterium]|nr:glycosyltransferase family 39 protein [Xanthomonadaceae bacterium]
MYIILPILVLWSFGLGLVPLLDWDEANFAEVAREMLTTGEWSFVRIGYEPFWEKPPLFFWLQTLSFKLFGVTEWAARFPNIIVAFLTLWVLYLIGKKRNPKFGLILVLTYAVSFLPQFYFKTGLIDPLFNLFIFSSFMLWNHFELTSHKTALVFSAILMSLAILTKGPTALLVCGSTLLIIWVIERKKSWSWSRPFVFGVFSLLSIVPYLIWMKHQGTLNQDRVASDFMSYLMRLFSTADAGHSGFPLFHVVVLAFGCMPASLYLYSGWKVSDSFSLRLKVLLVTIVVIFGMVQTKIIHYSSLAYFPLTYLAALGIEKQLSFKKEFHYLSQVAWLAFLAVLFFIPVIFSNESLMILIRDADLMESMRSAHSINPIKSLTSWSVMIFVLLVWVMLFSVKKINQRPIYLALSGVVTLQFWLVFVVPDIAQIAQGSLISFYKRAAKEKVNIQPLGFKSYASYFYSEFDPKRGAPVYAVSRARDQDWAMKNHPIQTLERTGGWVLYRMLK